MHQQVAAQAFEPLLAGFGADQEGQVGAVPGGDQLGGDRTAEKAGGPRQQDAFAGIDSGDLLTVGMHVHVFPLREVSRPRLDARVVAPQLMRGCLKEPLMALEPAKEAGHLPRRCRQVLLVGQAGGLQRLEVVVRRGQPVQADRRRQRIARHRLAVAQGVALALDDQGRRAQPGEVRDPRLLRLPAA